jgi:hypothetical protein
MKLRVFQKVLSITAILICSLMVCRAEPAGCYPAPIDQPLDGSTPINIELLRRSLVHYRCSRYDIEVGTVLGSAKDWIKTRAPQVNRPAIVLDIDETSLSNWEQIYHNQFAYFPSGNCDLKSIAPCGQRDWELAAGAVAVAPTLSLTKSLKEIRGKDNSEVAYFFVTGRYDDPFERLATEWNLRKVGYEGWRQLFMRPESSRSDRFVSCYKTGARGQIEAQGFTVIANIGDQLSDLVGEHAEKKFRVPNPFYFINGGTEQDIGCGVNAFQK